MTVFLCYNWLQAFVQGNPPSDLHQDIVAALPVKIVGRFLSTIIKNVSGKEATSLLSLLPAATHLSMSQTILPVYMGSRLTLHSVHNFTHMQLFQLIFTVFDGVPNSFQLLQCSSNTSRQQLDLFFDRLMHWKQFHYLVMGVNYLPNESQEVDIHILLNMRLIIVEFTVNVITFVNAYKIVDACTEVFPPYEWWTKDWLHWACSVCVETDAHIVCLWIQSECMYYYTPCLKQANMMFMIIILQDSSRLNQNVDKVLIDSGVKKPFKHFLLIYGHAGECCYGSSSHELYYCYV